MSDPALQESLARLAEVVHRLNEASDSLTTTIADLERKLLELNPGITVWCATPVRTVEGSDGSTWGSLLGFTKHGEDWGLWLRRGKLQRDGGGWEADPDPKHRSAMVKLLDASRDERVRAIAVFPVLVEAMTKTAKLQLKKLERVVKDPR